MEILRGMKFIICFHSHQFKEHIFKRLMGVTEENVDEKFKFNSIQKQSHSNGIKINNSL